MSIRPMDLQVLLPRVTEVGKTQQVTDNQTSAQQQYIAGEWRHIASQRQSQVQHAHKTEEGNVKDSLQKESHQGKQPCESKQTKRTSGKGINPEEPLSDPIRGHLIDIKT